jgi:ferredoxin
MLAHRPALERASDDRRPPDPSRAGFGLAYQPERCLPSRFPQIECRRCATACPTGALVPTAQGPQLAAGCVDCGQCVTACPTEALSVPGFAPPHLTALDARGHLSNQTPPAPVAIDCWRVPVSMSPAGALRVPCLGGLSVPWLLALVAGTAGRRIELLDRGFCAHCPAGGPEHPVRGVLAETQGLLDAMEVTAARWPMLVDRPLSPGAMQPDPGEPLLEGRVSRRGLFAGLLGAAPEPGSTAGRLPEPVAVRHAPPAPVGSPRRRLFAALTRLAPGHPAPSRLFPRLQGSAGCADHEVCASACPTGALSSYRDGGDRGIAFDAAACTACGVCVQLCPGQALSLNPSGGGAPRRERLTRFATRPCAQCGADHLGEDALCPACQRDREFAQDAFASLFGSAG